MTRPARNLVVALLLATSTARAAEPVCRPVGGPAVAITAYQREAGGDLAQPPIIDTTFGFAWPDTALNPVASANALETFASDGACHVDCADPVHAVYGDVTRTIGTDADPLGAAPPVEAVIQPNPDPSVIPNFPSYTYRGGGPVTRVPAGQVGAGKLLLVYHAEINTNTSVYSLLGLAASADEGVSWTDLGEIVRPNQPYAATLAGFDLGDPRLLLSPDGRYFLLHFADWLVAATPTYTATSVARAPVSAVLQAAFGAATPHAAAFRKFYQGGWSQPALGGVSSEVMPNTRYAGGHQGAYDPTIGRYVMILDDTQHLSLSLSADGVHWPPATLLGTFGGAVTSANYASPIGRGPDATVLGSSFDVFYTFLHVWQGAVVKRLAVTCG